MKEQKIDAKIDGLRRLMHMQDGTGLNDGLVDCGRSADASAIH